MPPLHNAEDAAFEDFSDLTEAHDSVEEVPRLDPRHIRKMDEESRAYYRSKQLWRQKTVCSTSESAQLAVELSKRSSDAAVTQAITSSRTRSAEALKRIGAHGIFPSSRFYPQPFLWEEPSCLTGRCSACCSFFLLLSSGETLLKLSRFGLPNRRFCRLSISAGAYRTAQGLFA